MLHKDAREFGQDSLRPSVMDAGSSDHGAGDVAAAVLLVCVRVCVSSLLFTVCFWSLLLNSRSSGVLPHKH